jgi:hypothetical protein
LCNTSHGSFSSNVLHEVASSSPLVHVSTPLGMRIWLLVLYTRHNVNILPPTKSSNVSSLALWSRASALGCAHHLQRRRFVPSLCTSECKSECARCVNSKVQSSTACAPCCSAAEYTCVSTNSPRSPVRIRHIVWNSPRSPVRIRHMEK